MAHTKNSKKTIIFISLVLLMLLMISWMISSHHVWTELEYCKEISRKLGWLPLDYFQCKTIDSSDVDSNYITIYFRAEPYYDGSRGFFVEDVAKAKEVIEAYLTEHPEHKLNQKKIAIQFEDIPGSYIVMTNFGAEPQIKSSAKFNHYSFFYLDINKASAFQDACTIELKVKDEDDLHLLEEWNNLELLKLEGMEFTDEDKQYLVAILPDCRIICNGEEIN